MRRPRYAYYYRKLKEYLQFVVPPGHRVLLLGCQDPSFLEAVRPSRGVGVDPEAWRIAQAARDYPDLEFVCAPYHQLPVQEPFEYIVLSDMTGQVEDLVALLDALHRMCSPSGRLIVLQHNYLWRPLLRLAARLGLKHPDQPQNWLSSSDLRVFLYAAGLETVQVQGRLFVPVNPCQIGRVANAALGLLPFVRRLASTEMIVARKQPAAISQSPPSCTVCLTVRDERDNIEPLVRAIPEVGSETEILFVEGHSVDGTAEEVRRVIAAYPQRHIRLLQQSGVGQGDAIRLGFTEARGDIIVLLEADQTSPPADVVKAYTAIATGRADYVNGSRFIYPKSQGAMGLLNTVGNYAFAVWFGWFLGQRTSDVLCGLKAISRVQYRKLHHNWGFLKRFDPFGDFELLFGASRLGLRICEVPTHYYPRQHGASKTRVFRHGAMLLKMAWRATLVFKCR